MDFVMRDPCLCPIKIVSLAEPDIGLRRCLKLVLHKITFRSEYYSKTQIERHPCRGMPGVAS